MEIMDSDLGGIPIFIRPGREVVVNKQGNAVLYIKHENEPPAFVSFHPILMLFFVAFRSATTSQWTRVEVRRGVSFFSCSTNQM